jgi:hypothetical protein
MVRDDPMDSEMFLAWVRQFLRPALRPGDQVVVDNLSSQKCPESGGSPHRAQRCTISHPIPLT